MRGRPWNTCLLLLGLFLQGEAPGYAQARRQTPSQSPVQTPGLVAPGQAFEHLTMEQGLPTNDVNGVLQDHEGYLWAATTDGLSRYDGYGFVTYKFDPRDPHSLNQNLCLSVFEDPDGDLWVGNIEGGINKFDRNTGQFINYRPPQPAGRFEPVLRSVSTMTMDKQGYYWVGSYSGELRRFDKKTGEFSAFDYDLGYHPQPGDLRGFDRITCIYRDKNQDIWIGNKSGLHQLIIGPGKPFDRSTIRFRNYTHDPADPNSLEGTEVAGIIEDHAGELWISTDSALNRFDRKTGHFFHFSRNPACSQCFWKSAAGNMVEDQQNYLWISTLSGLERLDPQRQRFDHFEHIHGDPNSLSAYNGYHVNVDRAGNIWVAGNGIDKLDPHQPAIIRYRHNEHNQNSLASDWVHNVCADRTAGTLWFATSAGLDALDKRTGHFRHYRHDPADPGSLSDEALSGDLQDDQGMIWVCSIGGTIDRLDPGSGVFTHYIGLHGQFANTDRHYYGGLYRDHNGTIWIAEYSSGVTALDYKQGRVQHYAHDPADPNGMSDYLANAACEDDSGFIWIAHGSVATDRLDPRTGQFRHYKYHPGDPGSISSNCVKSLLRDHQGNMWFGTLGGGLCLFHPAAGSFTTYTEKDGLLDNTVNSIVEDDEGNLWLGTGKGMCRFNPAKKQFTNFDYPNSPQSDRIVHFYGKDSDGVLYFNNGDEGVKAFDPAKLQPNRYIPPVVITGFRLFNRPQPFNVATHTIELAHDQNFFSFDFSALNYTDTRKNQYAYKLDGVDKDWVYAGTRRSADYTALAPGNYTFHVKASNNEGLWNDKGTVVQLIIRPPWWRTWWAWTIYTLLALAGIWLLDRQRRLRLIEKEQQRSLARELEMQALRAQMNPHFIFNCLTSINRFILKSDMLSASDYLTKFSRLIRMVLNHSKQSLISLEEELEMLRLYLELEKLRFKEAFVYRIDIGEALDTSAIFLPPMLFQPFVENAIWHGLMHKKEPGRLDIQLRVAANILSCSITDDGVGRSFAEYSTSKSAQKQKSMGMGITRQRLALINGNEAKENSLVIEDLYDQQGKPAGTKVVLRIRVRETALPTNT
jgi:ligand-binding sensor domain-containing protein